MTRYRQNREIAWRDIEGEAILFDTERALMRQLNEVATELWAALEEEHSLPDLVDLVCRRFDVSSDRARPDVEAFLAKMVERRLVEVRE